MNHIFNHLHGFILLIISFSIVHYNSYVGAITTTLLCLYAAVKLYNEIKNKKTNREDPTTKDI